jgi:hypothetical protein
MQKDRNSLAMSAARAVEAEALAAEAKVAVASAIKMAKAKDSAAVEDVDSKATADTVAKAASHATLVVIEGMFQKLRSEILQGTVHQSDSLHSSRKDKVRKKKRKTEKKLEASSSGDSSTSDDSSSPRTTTKKTHKRYRARSGFRFKNLMHKLEAQRVLHAAERRENIALDVQRAILKAKYKS